MRRWDQYLCSHDVLWCDSLRDTRVTLFPCWLWCHAITCPPDSDTPMSPEPLDPHPDNPGSAQLWQYSHAGTSHSLPSERLREERNVQTSRDDARLTRQKCIIRGVRWLGEEPHFVRVSSYQYLVPGIMILPPRAPHDCEFPPPWPHKWRYQT